MSICFELPIYLILIGRLSIRDSTRIDVGRWPTCFSMLRQSDLRLEIFEDANFYTVCSCIFGCAQRPRRLSQPTVTTVSCMLCSFARALGSPILLLPFSP